MIAMSLERRELEVPVGTRLSVEGLQFTVRKSFTIIFQHTVDSVEASTLSICISHGRTFEEAQITIMATIMIDLWAVYQLLISDQEDEMLHHADMIELYKKHFEW